MSKSIGAHYEGCLQDLVITEQVPVEHIQRCGVHVFFSTLAYYSRTVVLAWL